MSRPSRFAFVSFLAVLLLGLVPTLAVAAEPAELPSWDQWRGPERTGSSPGEAWPTSLNGLESLWTVDLGKGYPGPVIHGGKVFVIETADDATEQARAFDIETGEELWRSSWQGRFEVPFFARKNGSWVRSTPAVDGKGLYVSGMQEVLRRLDLETGEEIWSMDLPAIYGTKEPDFGFATSPLLDDGTLYVQGADSVLKVDAESGEVIWRALDGDTTIFNSGAFSSPILAEVAGRQQLLVQTRETLFGLDPQTGDALWSQDVPHFRGMNILTPVVVGGNRIFTSSYRNKSYLYEIAVGDSSEKLESTQIWEHKANAYMSSPVLVGDHAYVHLGNRRLLCLDMTTGEETWTSTPFGEYWSMAERDGRILALDSDGELILLQADPAELKVLDRRQVSDESTWAHLAVAGDLVFVRGLESLQVFRWGTSRTSSAADPVETAAAAID